jgi:hypothetical protein
MLALEGRGHKLVGGVPRTDFRFPILVNIGLITQKTK